MSDVTCSKCFLPVNPNEQGVRCYGFSIAHEENRCIYLLRQQLAERDAALARCVEAIKALLIMNDCGPSPRKLDDALTWRQNDEKARSLAIAAISGLPDSAQATAKDTDAR